MFKLKLIKSRSYRGVLSATKSQPYVETDSEEKANLAVATGYFALISADVPESDAGSEDNGGDETGTGSEPDYNALSEMTKAELTAYAEQNGISLEGCTTKAEMLEAISIANGGSPTMLDLQNQ